MTTGTRRGDALTQELGAILELDDLAEGTTRWGFEIAAADLQLDDQQVRVPRPLHVSLSVVRSIQHFAVDGTIDFEVEGECYRCLAAATQQVEATVRVLIQRKEATDDELEAAADEDEIEIVYPGTRSVDLKQQLRDSAILELPMRVQCRPDCKGLCSQCGQDLNAGSCDCAGSATDPRWDALATLKSTYNNVKE